MPWLQNGEAQLESGAMPPEIEAAGMETGAITGLIMAHGKYSLSCIYDCFVNIRIYSIHCIIYLNYSN